MKTSSKLQPKKQKMGTRPIPENQHLGNRPNPEHRLNDKRKSPIRGFLTQLLPEQQFKILVAGAGFEPTTFGL
jgi:hypothetical protein